MLKIAVSMLNFMLLDIKRKKERRIQNKKLEFIYN